MFFPASKVFSLSVSPNDVVGLFGIEDLVTLGTYVELFRVLHDHLHDILTVGTPVGTETPEFQVKVLHHLKEAAQGLGLYEADVGVAVPVLYIGNQAAYGHHAGAVSKEVLVGALGIVLLCLDELVVEIYVVLAAMHHLGGGEQQLDEQAVQFPGGVEIIALARLGSYVGHVVCRKLFDGTQHGVGAWNAGAWTVG